MPNLRKNTISIIQFVQPIRVIKVRIRRSLPLSESGSKANMPSQSISVIKVNISERKRINDWSMEINQGKEKEGLARLEMPFINVNKSGLSFEINFVHLLQNIDTKSLFMLSLKFYDSQCLLMHLNNTKNCDSRTFMNAI